MGRAHLSSTFPPENRTAATPPLLEIVLVSFDDWGDEPEGLDDCGGAVLVVRDVVVVVADDDLVVDEGSVRSVPLESDFDFEPGSEAFLVVFVVVGTTVLVVDAAGIEASANVPAVAPGRGSVLAGDAGAGFDVASAESPAAAVSTREEAGGVVAPVEGVPGSATSSVRPGAARAA